jgi:hypothetical protein
VNVLPGDATGDGRVNALDMAEVKRHLNGRVPDPGGLPDGVYSVFSDIDTSGHINALDVASVRRNLTFRLPASEPAAAGEAWPVRSITRDVLGGTDADLPA